MSPASLFSNVMLAAAMSLAISASSARAQELYADPDAASKALVSAAAAKEKGFVERIFGKGALDLLSSGDAAEDAKRLESFNAAAAEKLALEEKGADKRILRLGENDWAFPIPIVKRGDKWAYDVAAGRAELINRTIGFNELSAIEACRTYIAAQKEYFRDVDDGDNVQEYAQRIISTPNTRDGLYWPPQDQADISPLAGFMTDAILASARKAEPYRGYFYKILKAQGPAAPGGAYNYVINGNMIGGFALLAVPAKYGRTGVMSFICNQQGIVFQKDLGRRSTALLKRIWRYNPDASWTPVE